ncbi:Multidrug resistance protein B [Legionella massiliensis]|uniref:Multidrug resistance protein B n=1 Tax=Legionella massiliensis TaxID=1034943 RepID=A0A078KT11_9GAMM|nr:MFS transporter [Legionella massiliensis]CDZ77580.1 Multidrug resistance protein B [Legionella massiliensis]CEE13318.1 Multidrug export protein EmrB [Legionella massiliensis]
MILYVLILSLLAVIFNLTLPIMSGLYIVSDLGGSDYLTSYAVSFFAIGNILGIPLGKPRATGLKPLHLYIGCLFIMGFCSWQCAIAHDYFHFILFRFLEGIASGPLFLLITAVLIPYLAPEKEKPFILSLLLVSFSVGPVLAASYGGWIAYYHNWRILFYSNIPLCLFLIVYLGYMHSKDAPPAQTRNFDLLGYFFYSVAVIFIGTALTTGQELDWFRSSLINFLLITGGISLVFFILQSRYSSAPILDLSLLKNFYFSLAMFIVTLLFAIYFGMVVLLGLWLKLYVNYTPNWIALIIGTMAFAAWIPIVINYKRFEPRLSLAFALLFIAVSCFYTTYFNQDINFDRIAFTRILAGLGLAIFLAPLFRLSVNTVRPEKTIESVCFFHVARLLGSGLGVALFVILWHRRQVFYHLRLGADLTAFSQLTRQFLERAQLFHLQGQQALAQLDVFLTREATALALDDCFYLMGWMTLFILGLVLATFFLQAPILHEQE